MKNEYDVSGYGFTSRIEEVSRKRYGSKTYRWYRVLVEHPDTWWLVADPWGVSPNEAQIGAMINEARERYRNRYVEGYYTPSDDELEKAIEDCTKAIQNISLLLSDYQGRLGGSNG